MVDGGRDFYLRRKPDGTIAFRIKVPIQLKQAVGRNELQMNLPADNQELALELARCCQDHFQRLTKVEPMVEAFDSQKVRRVVKQHMEDIIERWRAGRPLDTDDQWFCEQRGIEEHIDRLREGIGRRQFLKHAGATSQRLFGQADATLARELMLAEIRAFQQILMEMESGPHPSVLDGEEGLGDRELEDALPSSPQPPTPPEPEAEASGPITLRDALDQFVDHKLTTGKWTANTVRDMRARMNAMAAFFGENAPVSSITLDSGKLYVKRLQAMRQGFVAREDVQAVIRGEKEDPATDRPLLNNTSIREYLMLARAVFTFCEASGWFQGTDGNPTTIHPIPSMLIPVKKKGRRDNKKAFTPEQVEGILSSPEFNAWADTPAKRWLFPILAYTGARIEEVCKLRQKDIREQDGVPVIDINESMGRVKNEHSNRVVPIHDKLLQMGLVEFAASRPSPDSMLFEELKPYRGRWSAQILKLHNYFLHNQAGFGKGYSNHSFRHYANNELVKRGVRMTVADQLLGRVQQGVGGQVYFKGHFMESLREAINQIP